MSTKVANMHQVLPYLGFQGDVLVSNHLDMTVGFKLQLPELFTQSETGLNALHACFCKLLKQLPEQSLLQKVDYMEESIFKGHPHQDSLTQSYLQHFEGRKKMQFSSYLFVSLLREDLTKDFLSSALSGGTSSRKQLKEQKHKLDEVKLQVIELLKQGGVGCEPLTSEAIILLTRKHFSQQKENVKALLGAIDFRNQLKVMNTYVDVFSISDYAHLPNEISPCIRNAGNQLPVSSIFPLTYGLAFSHSCNLFVYKPNQSKEKKYLEDSRRKMYSLSNFSTENRVNAALIAELLEQVQQTGEPLVKMHFNLMFSDESVVKLREKRSEVQAAFSQINCMPYRHSFDAPYLYFASAPGSTQLSQSHMVITQVPQALCLTDFEGEIRNSQSEFKLYLSDRLDGCPVALDISDEPMKQHLIHNRNKIIIGGSGSGKSFLTNHLLRYYGESPQCHVVLLDVGRSYELLVAYFSEYLKDKGGAMLVEFTQENPISFNPFVIEGTLSMERKQTIISILSTIYKPILSSIEADVISYSVSAYFTDTRYERSFNGYYEFCKESLPELIKSKDISFNTGEFFFILSKYYKGGEYDYLLNKEMDTDLFFHCPFIVFELDSIKDHPVIFPVATLIIMDIFLQKMHRLKGYRKVICIEEAWKAIATPQMADYIKYFFKTIRKHFGEAIVVTQEVDDIIASPIIRDAIVNNADTRILLDMRKFSNKFDDISAVLGLNEFQKQQVLSVNKDLPADRKLKECFIALGDYSRVFALEVSRPEYYCYTSEQKEKELVKTKIQEDDKSVLETLKHL